MCKWKAKLTSKGNIKLGNSMGVWSVLYGDKTFHINSLNLDVKGTCGHHCANCENACYVRKSYRYGSVMLGHARNTIAIRESVTQTFIDIDGQLTRKRKPFQIVRINQSGEIESAEQFIMWLLLAQKHPETHFYIYTKAFDYVLPEIKKNAMPDNFTVLISIWHEYGLKEYEQVKHIPNVKAFIYDDGYKYPFEIDTRCYAYDKAGKLNHAITCENCKKCFDRSCKTIACNDH